MGDLKKHFLLMKFCMFICLDVGSTIWMGHVYKCEYACMFPNCAPLYILMHSFMLNLKFTNTVNLANQFALWIHCLLILYRGITAWPPYLFNLGI